MATDKTAMNTDRRRYDRNAKQSICLVKISKYISEQKRAYFFHLHSDLAHRLFHSQITEGQEGAMRKRQMFLLALIYGVISISRGVH